MGEYKGKDHFPAAESKEESFKKGGRTKKKAGGALFSKAAGKGEMKSCGGKTPCRADRPGRKSGGAVFSSAASGTPRGKASHY
jgi:hypothetical protein